MTEAIDSLLFHTCRDFLAKLNEYQHDHDDAASAMAAFIDKIRPARPKLNMDITPEVVAMLDGSAAREADALWAADWALKMAAEEMRANTAHGKHSDLVKIALTYLAEARKQVEAAPAHPVLAKA